MSKVDHTKMLLAESLKQIMNIKPLKKVSVQDIVDGCGMSRHTFYYHFIDKQDLVNWIYRNDILSRVRPVTQLEHWNKSIIRILMTMKQNQTFYVNALNTEGQNSLGEYCFEEALKDFLCIIDKYVGDRHIDEASRNFIARFYAYGISRMIIEWAKRGMKESPELMGCWFVDVIEGGIFSAIEKSIKVSDEANKY